jgi:conjugative transfer region protein TrbK
MDPKIIIRAIAVALLAGSVLACAIEVGRFGAADRPNPSTSGGADPSSAELLRCTRLGAQSLKDASCQAAWAKNRRHFFGAGRARPGHQPDIFPALRKKLPTKAPAKAELNRAPSAPLRNTATAPGATQQGH